MDMSFLDEEHFKVILLNTKNIVGLPGSGFGPNGEGYFRLTGFGNYEESLEAIKKLKNDYLYKTYSKMQ